jgi:hypothetical protein
MAAEQPKSRAADENSEVSKTSASESAKTVWWRFLTQRWFAALVVALLVIPIVGFLFLRPKSAPPTPVVPPTEITLGEFRFTGGKGQDCCLAEVDFALAVTLLSQVDDSARTALAAHRLRVQQAIEQLLRTAHSADFDDPPLTELKRRIREQIDRTLNMRAVSEIIITDLKVRQSDRSVPSAVAPPTAVTADSK